MATAFGILSAAFLRIPFRAVETASALLIE
jgi:hypothetical protein